MMQKQKSSYNHISRLGRSIAGAHENIGYWLIKTKMTPIESTKMSTRIKIKLNLTISLLLIVSLWAKPPRKTTVMKAIKEAI